MRYYRVLDHDCEIFLGVEKSEGEIVLIRSSFSEPMNFTWMLGKEIDEVAHLLLQG